MIKHNKGNKAEELKASLSALVVSAAQNSALPPPPETPPVVAPTADATSPGGSTVGEEAALKVPQFIRLGLSLFPRDFDQIGAIMAEGLKRGQRLNQSQAIRVALRALDLARVPTAEMEAVRLDDRRRKLGEQKLSRFTR